MLRKKNLTINEENMSWASKAINEQPQYREGESVSSLHLNLVGK